MKGGKRLKGLLILCIFLLFSCSSKTTFKLSRQPSSLRDSYERICLSVSSQKDRILITIPIKKETVFSYSYTFPSLKIKFSTSISNLKIPSKFKTDVINTIKALNSDTISILLKKDVQFIILRDSPERLKIILVPKEEQIKNQSRPVKNLLSYIKFYKDQNNNLFICLKAQEPFTYKILKTKKKHLKLLFPELTIPLRFRKLYNLSKFKSVVRSSLLEQTEEGGALTIYFVQRVPVNLEKGKDWLKIEVNGIWANLIKKGKKEVALKNTHADISKTKAPPISIILPGMRTTYTGIPISIDLQDADIKHVLRLLSEVGKFNLVLDDSVKGKISLKLKNIPWDQVLDLILLQKNLGMVKQGNIIRVAPLKKLKEEQERIVAAREALLKAKKSQEKLAPLVVEYIQINYATASDLLEQLKGFLSKRGRIGYDSRTNQIIVCDTEANIKKIKSIIRKLDRPEKQVLIEARIVYVTDTFQRSLGIRWGGGLTSYKIKGGDITNYGIYGTQDSINEFAPKGDLYSVPPLSNKLIYSKVPTGFAVNLIPNQGLTSGTLGLFVSKLSGTDFFTLNAQLSLGESKGLVKTISSPRIVTLNNQKAVVSQGTKIATKTESESGGTTTEYVEATLKLSVTPQITPDNKLVLDLEISDDSPVPGGEDIETRRASTKLIVNDGETVVIGGVQTYIETESYERVPGLSRIPLLGWLFKNKVKTKEKRELLIFIRPKIL